MREKEKDEKGKERASAVVAALMGAAAVAFVTLAVLKICGVVGWSWLWITAPVWGFVLLSLLSLGFLAMCVVFLSMQASKRNRR